MFIKIAISLLFACQIASGSILDMPGDIAWTKAINAQLCQPGAHPDEVASQFYACYDETIVPGGSQFIRCMDSVYGVRMDTEAHIDQVCNASSDKFPKYALCILTRLPLHGHLPSTSMHKLNVCQGAVLGVAPPQ